MPGFVIQYNRRTGASEVTAFDGEGGHREALKMRLRLDAERVDDEIEIVSVVSDSLETVRQTHSRYFRSELADAS
jgi:hypothetical protein